MRRWSLRALIAAPCLCLGLLAGKADANLIGQTVTVALGDGGSLDYQDNVIVDAGAEITPGDGSQIGGVLLPTELVDIGSSSILLQLEEGEPGGGTGYPADTAYEFSNLSFLGELTAITGISVSTVNVSGLSPGDVTFTASSLRIPISALTVGEIPGVDVGSITIDLDFVVVPEPASALLGALGLGLLAWTRASRAR